MRMTNPKNKINVNRKEKSKAHKKRERIKNRDFIKNYKKDKFCAFCGYREHPEILVYHHVKGVKKWDLSKMKIRTLTTIKREIEKCILLCPNCHMWLHYKEGRAENVI